jgi:hypothetical protein
MNLDEILVTIALALLLLCVYNGHKLFKTMERNIDYQYKKGYLDGLNYARERLAYHTDKPNENEVL